VRLMFGEGTTDHEVPSHRSTSDLVLFPLGPLPLKKKSPTAQQFEAEVQVTP
jgi:hypothetical protein